MAGYVIRVILVVLMVLVGSGIFISAPAAATLLALQVGMEGPAFTLKDLSGQTAKSSDLKGDQLTVLVFWSTWSRKSEAVLARMQKLYDRYKSKGLSVIGVNADEQKVGEKTLSDIRSVQDRLKITYPFLIDEGLATFHDYGVIALPTTIVLDLQRTITRELSGYPLIGSEELSEYITTSMEGKGESVAATEKAGYKPNKNAVRLYNMGRNTLRSKRMQDTAETWFKKAVEADPGFVLPRLSLAGFYRSRGVAGMALAQYREVLSREPQNPIALCEGGILLVEQGSEAEGKRMLETAIKGEAPIPSCYYYSGYVAGRAGQSEAALALFDEAEKINPRDHLIFVYKAKLFEEQKDIKRAAEAYRKGVEIIIASP